MLQPVHGAAQETTLVAGFGGHEQRGAVIQRLPVGQTRAGLFGPHRIPPVFTGDGGVGRHVMKATFFQCRAERCAKCAFPDLKLERGIAKAHGLIDRLTVGRNILNGVTHGFEHLTDDIRHHDLA